MLLNFATLLEISLLGYVKGHVVDSLSPESFHSRMLTREFTDLDNCMDLDGLEKCCSGDDVCNIISDSFLESYLTVSKGGCRETKACLDAFNVEVGSYSCVGKYACHLAENAEVGSHSCVGSVSACQNSGAAFDDIAGKFKVGESSCLGSTACVNSASKNGNVVIGDKSCKDEGSCHGTGNFGGFFRVGDESCQGLLACKWGGNAGSLIVGDKSCVGRLACTGQGSGTNMKTTIGEKSCNGIESCKLHPRNELDSMSDNTRTQNAPIWLDDTNNVPESYTIGDNSCNSELDTGICMCLRNGDIVPDNSCNTFGEDQCCSTKSTRGSKVLSYPLRDWNIEYEGLSSLDAVIDQKGIVKINLPFATKTTQFKSKVLSGDCISQPNDAFSISTSELDQKADGISFVTSLQINSTELEIVNNATFNFCVKSYVYATIESTEETMNFITNNITISFLLDADFKVLEMSTEDIITINNDAAVDYSEYVNAYECLTNDPDTEQVEKFYRPGEKLVICVTDSDGSNNDGTIVKVSNIRSLAVSQTQDGASNDFKYIEEFKFNNILVSKACDIGKNSDVCAMELQLLGRFFAVETPSELTVRGSIEFESTSTSTRFLHTKEDIVHVDNRRVQEDERIGGFSVVVKLESLGSTIKEMSAATKYEQKIVHFSLILCVYNLIVLF